MLRDVMHPLHELPGLFIQNRAVGCISELPNLCSVRTGTLWMSWPNVTCERHVFVLCACDRAKACQVFYVLMLKVPYYFTGWPGLLCFNTQNAILFYKIFQSFSIIASDFKKCTPNCCWPWFTIDIWKQGSFYAHDWKNNFMNMNNREKWPPFIFEGHFINLCGFFWTLE